MKLQFLRQCAATLGLLTSLVSASHGAAYDDFFAALKNDNINVVRTLIGRGMDPNVVDEGGEPALIRAVRHDADKVVEVLLAARDIDVNRANPAGETALMVAAFRGRKPLVERLLKMEAEVNKTGWTPLHYAAAVGQDAIVALLIDRYAYIDAESPNQTTPIMMAARGGHIKTVRLLLDEGADVTLKNEQGMTAIDFAERHGFKEIAEGLRERAKRQAERALKPWK